MQVSIRIFVTLLLISCHSLLAQTIKSNGIKKPSGCNLKFIFVPSLLIISGISTNGNGEDGFKKEIAEERNEHFPKFGTRLDQYLQFSPIAIAYGLDGLGYKSKTALKNRTAVLLKGELFMTSAVFGLKRLTHQLRPDNSGDNSFPSGHTAQAFAAATFLSEEYQSKFKWMPYLAYGIATSVGVLRMANNKHYISDVLLGAGLGILSMKVSYLTHQYKWSKEHKPNSIF
ncbi:MAG: phosphatase PAP2 family protein [Ferruginibacter sp.]